MITEAPRGNPIIRAISIALFRDYDLETKYEIPAFVDHRIPQPEGVSIWLQGPKDNLWVMVETPQGGVELKKIASPGITFAIGLPYGGRVSTDLKGSKVTIPAGRNHRKDLVFSIVHGISRVNLHRNEEDRHHKSEEAHRLLASRLSHLQAYGKVYLPEDQDERQRELEAWEFVTQEERLTAELAIASLVALRGSWTDLLPHIKTYRQLTDVVNSSHMLRTSYQLIIDPRWTGKQIGMPMTLTEERVRELTLGFYR